MSKMRFKILFFVLLILLFLVDFFVVGNYDSVCRQHKGYSYSYFSDGGAIKSMTQFGVERIKYNFENFFIFWISPPIAQTFTNLKEFITCDGNTAAENIFHFVGFFAITLIILYFFRLNIWYALLIGFVFNIFHEYVAEGICCDPSFLDLWLDSGGIALGILFFLAKRVIWMFRE
ncbi:MAG: hypothetical protein WC697_00130 [Patescibacteria group bacterium]|jgi:hypothetical protein